MFCSGGRFTAEDVLQGRISSGGRFYFRFGSLFERLLFSRVENLTCWKRRIFVLTACTELFWNVLTMSVSFTSWSPIVADSLATMKSQHVSSNTDDLLITGKGSQHQLTSNNKSNRVRLKVCLTATVPSFFLVPWAPGPGICTSNSLAMLSWLLG